MAKTTETLSGETVNVAEVLKDRLGITKSTEEQGHLMFDGVSFIGSIFEDHISFSLNWCQADEYPSNYQTVEQWLQSVDYQVRYGMVHDDVPELIDENHVIGTYIPAPWEVAS